MLCPKCKKQIDDKSTVCPHCKKVLVLECPRCGNHSETNTCSNCGYIILSKCTNCGTLNRTDKKVCIKCGESTLVSAAKRLTENERFSALTLNCSNIAKLTRTLGSKKLVTKFLYKLKNLLLGLAKEEKAYFVMYTDNIFILNFASEVSEYTSAQKAMKTAIKLLNILCNLNRTLKKELMFTLEARITVEEKDLKTFFDINEDTEKVKLLDLYTEQSSEAKGLQITVDQYIYKYLRKEYKMDSLYSAEREGNIIAYYSLNTEDYIIPDKEDNDAEAELKSPAVKIVTKKELDFEQELYKKNIEGIKVNCKFEQMGAEKIYEYLKNVNFQQGNRIISLRGDAERDLPTSMVEKIIKEKAPCYTIICTENLSMEPWGFFTALVNEIYYNSHNKQSIGTKGDKMQEALIRLSPPGFADAESARLAYIETFLQLLTSLPQSVIYIENFEYIDLASLRVLEEVFSKINRTKLSFVITNCKGYALQKFMPELLKSYYYTEVFIGQMNIEEAIAQLVDSEDFKSTYYYKKIIDNAGASYLYCVNAINYLKDSGIIITFNDKTVVTDSKTVILPFDLEHLINTRLKRISKDTAKSLILAYSYILGPVIEYSILDKLGLNNADVIRELENSGFISASDSRIYIQNYEILSKSFKTTLKPEVLKYLSTNLIGKVFGNNSINYRAIISLDCLNNYSLAFSKLYELSITTLQFGDYDAYLKMCIKLLKLLKDLEKDIPEEELAEYQSDFYNNLTQLLYRYAPERIYPIAENLLQKAVKSNDDEKIVTLSNMMLQGGLLTSNYTNTVTLLQNILERLDNSALADKSGNVNYKVFSLSLVSLEIYFYLGLYDKCITVSNDILEVLTPEKIIKLKPEGFSEEQFFAHILDSFVYYLISLVLTGESNIDKNIARIKTAVGKVPASVPVFEVMRNLLCGETQVEVIPQNTDDECYTLLSKLVNSFIGFNGDYGVFAANIYDYKRTASEQSKTPYILLGDLLIGYAYKALGGYEKAGHIFNSVLNKGKNNSLFFITHMANYLIADLCTAQENYQTALQILTNSITIMERTEHPCLLLLYLLKKKLVEIVEIQQYNIDVSAEKGFIAQTEFLFKGLAVKKF